MHKTGILTSLFMKRYLALLIPVIIAAGCKNNHVFTVDGSLKDNKHKYIYISKVDIDTPVLIDSSKISSKGIFRFRIKATETDFYQVGYSETDFVNLLAEPGEKIKLIFNSENLYNNYTVSGSEGSELVQTLDLKLLQTRSRVDSLNTIYGIASKERDFQTRGPLLEQEYLNLLKQQRKFNIEFIIKNINSLASIKALYQKINDQVYVLYEARDLQYLKIVSDSLKVHYPDSKHTKALLSDFEKEMNQFYARRLEQLTSNIPPTTLDPKLPDINGKRIALSSLKGKYVLLAFWSAEVKDCIIENLQLKEYYKMFYRKGFEIYQINLDKDESTWKAAVKFDELPWINTREENPEDQKNARLYNVKTLPANYLIDPKGDIIASNLHGKALQIKLNQLFN
jgi:thiol-disulfide isomerase/thioredoxin